LFFSAVLYCNSLEPAMQNGGQSYFAFLTAASLSLLFYDQASIK